MAPGSGGQSSLNVTPCRDDYSTFFPFQARAHLRGLLALRLLLSGACLGARLVQRQPAVVVVLVVHVQLVPPAHAQGAIIAFSA